MATPASRTASAKQAAVSQHELLDALVAIVAKHASEQWGGVSTRLVASLLDVDSPTLDARDVFLRVKSGNLLKDHHYAFVHLASDGLEKALRKEVAALLPRPRSALIAEAALSLVPFEEMDTRVAFDSLSRPFEMKYATQIATLNVRLGFLLNRDILNIAQNPFRPEMFLSALNSAWKEFEPNEESHALITSQLRPALLWDFGPMYDALCDALMSKGTQPGSVDAYNIRKTEGASSAKAKRAKQQAALASQLRQFLDGGADGGFDDIPMIPDLPQGAGGAGGGWRPSGVLGVATDAPGASLQAGPGFAAAFAGAAHAHGAAAHFMGGAPTGQGATAHPHFMQGGAAASQYGGHGGHGVSSTHQGGHVAGAGQAGAQAFQGEHGGAHFIGGAQPAAYAAAGQILDQAGFGAAPAPLLDMLKTLQARMPEQFAASPSRPGPAQGADVFYLPRLKASIPKGSLTRGDESTIDLLSKIFDTVFIDPNIPKEMRNLIQFLQIPVLKAALADKNFFFEEAHPARRMINLLSSMGLDQRSADDPLFKAMQRSVERVGDEADDTAGLFTTAVAELEDSIKAEEKFEVQAIAAPIEAALKQEKVVAATRSAKSAVAARVSSGEVVAVLETFLEQRWTSVLTVAYSVEEEKPGAVGSATRTMDDLIWSVKPKITRDERKSLIAKLPGLLSTLNQWLDIIKWQEAERLQFFAELAECHASIVRAPLDISPERQLEIAVEVAQQDAMRRLEKDQAAQTALPVVPDEAEVTVEGLERGGWLAFTQSDGSVRKAKLAWVSPLKTLYIFSLGARQDSFSLTVEKLTAGLRQNKVSIVQLDGVVERALSQAMGAGAVNDTDITAAA
ncbi:DUF1631 family protein [Massilia sp. TWP1-3-3]|uniref:DUF1631 family protein n=1 Tax=Massilia sp. TWP1-3-3 TaxID=2804573 RepID=UPI003CF01E19